MYDELLSKVFRFLGKALCTPTCISCGRVGREEGICQDCFSNIHFLKGIGRAEIGCHYSRLSAIAAYEGPILEILHKCKYAKSRAPLRLLSELMKLSKEEWRDIGGIVPVPLHWTRYLKRGYNHAALLAAMVARDLEKPLLRRAIARRESRSRQVGKSFEERKKNLKGAFGLPRFLASIVRGKNILLVDDVVTSGATVDECAKVLKKAGAARVDVLALAKTL